MIESSPKRLDSFFRFMKFLAFLFLLVPILFFTAFGQTESSGPGADSSPDSSASADGQTGPEESMVAPANYRIQPSDIIQVVFYQHGDLNKEVRVEADGTINLHLVGRVNVEGLTVTEVREKIIELYDRDYLVNPQADIRIVQFNLDKVQVLGQVRSPGTVTIPPEEDLTLIQAIARVGGFTRLARKGSVKIRREMEDGETKVFAINASDLISDPDAQDFVLQDGDIVFIDERFI